MPAGRFFTFHLRLLRDPAGEISPLRRRVTASSQAPYRSLPPYGESSLIPLLVLSPRDPLRWARAGTPDTAAKSPKRRLETYGF